MDSQQPPRTARNILGYYCGHLSCMPVVCRTHYKLQRDASYLVWTVNSLQGLLETFWVTIVVISVACLLCAGHITNFKGMLPIWCGQSTASKGRSCRSLVQDVFWSLAGLNYSHEPDLTNPSTNCLQHLAWYCKVLHWCQLGLACRASPHQLH